MPGSPDRTSFTPGRVNVSPSDTQGGSRVPELGSLGSVRGALSNGRPYRDLDAVRGGLHAGVPQPGLTSARPLTPAPRWYSDCRSVHSVSTLSDGRHISRSAIPLPVSHSGVRGHHPDRMSVRSPDHLGAARSRAEISSCELPREGRPLSQVDRKCL